MGGRRQRAFWCGFLAAAGGGWLWAACASAADLGRVELIRDAWGAPHIFASSDAGAMYGLGWATAEDRGFQMVYALRVIQGRLAETIGNVGRINGRATALDSDRKMRTFGFYRAARRVAAGLDEDSRRLLQAYCDGVNDWFRTHRGDRHELFDRLGVEPPRWTPADCIASWWRVAQFFGPDGTRDLVASRAPARGRGAAGRGGARAPDRGRGAGRPSASPPPVGDEEAAVVTREDVSPEWVERVDRFLADHGLLDGAPRPAPSAGGPRFSHAWVVGGAKTETGSSVLVSDPQTLVGNPSMFYEFHIQGATFNARGVGVPGSPVLLIGFTKHVAWGMTALGADQADLFRLKTDPDHPDQYFFDGQWRPMEVERHTIRVKGGEDRTFKVRWTHFGPVVTDFVFARPGDGQFALKRVPVCDANRETIQGALAMLRAKSAAEFGRALAGWRFPSANVVFGDAAGEVGYWVLGALPVRSAHAPMAGRWPQDGSQSRFDWQGFLPHDLKPHVIGPRAGLVFSANHRPVASFYKAYIGSTTGAMGETLRSFRLRERLLARSRFSPRDVLDIHYDDVNPARRELVRMGLHLRDVMQYELSPAALRALERLGPWFRRGAHMDLNQPGAELAMEINTMFRMVNTELALQYGGGETGLCLFLKDVGRRLAGDPTAPLTPLEAQYVDRVLAAAWESAVRRYGPDPQQWRRRAREAVAARRMGYYVSLDGFPSLDPQHDLAFPPLDVVDGATIRSQAAQAYTQFVPMHAVDQALSLLPIGASERPESEFRTSTFALWAEGKLHPAPLSRPAVLKLARSRRLLQPSGP